MWDHRSLPLAILPMFTVFPGKARDVTYFRFTRGYSNSALRAWGRWPGNDVTSRVLAGSWPRLFVNLLHAGPAIEPVVVDVFCEIVDSMAVSWTQWHFVIVVGTRRRTFARRNDNQTRPPHVRMDWKIVNLTDGRILCRHRVAALCCVASPL